MTPPQLSPTSPHQVLDDDAWDDLLDHIEDGRVIPIVGPELLKVETETGPRLLYDWLAEKLAAKLGVDTGSLPVAYTLNDVVCSFLAARGRREEAYTRLRSVLRDTPFAPPRALRQLAQISTFDLFVSTTFDPLLEQAINAERFSGASGPQGTEVLAYAPNRVVDLPVEREQLTRPVVYHLLGRVSASPTYVLSDEDMLEFICGLQSEHLAPEKLFHELEHSHLLLIGGNFTNWLARLFLRMAKRKRLSDPRDVGEVLADGHSGADRRLMSFLQQVSVRTRVYDGAAEFVDELHRRWMARGRPGRPAGGHPARSDERRLATVLFTDIVSSTEMAVRLGDRAWREMLQHFLLIARQQLALHRGQEVDNAGDGVFAIFDAPARAVSCGLAMAREAQALGISIRGGVHTGEIDAGGAKVAGIAVHTGARVMSQAAAGEVWVSSTVRDLTSGAGLQFEPRGEHVLKGLPGQSLLFRAVNTET
jgi:class 3 adenylate cyclase